MDKEYEELLDSQKEEQQPVESQEDPNPIIKIKPKLEN